MFPQAGEYFIGVEPILEFLIELPLSARDGDVTIEPNKPHGEVSDTDETILEDLVNDSCLIVMQK